MLLNIALAVTLAAAGGQGQATSAAVPPGEVSGIVRDASGGVLPGATVRLGTPAGSRSTVTNARGRYVFAGVSEGAYELSVMLSGFRTARYQVRMASDRGIAANLHLELGSLSEEITVTGQRPAPPAGAAAQPAPPGAADPVAPIRVGGSIREPRKIRDVKPVYPAEALAAGTEGTVILEAVIGKDGTVQSTRVMLGAPLLDAAAVAAVEQWQFTPTLLNGVPQEVQMTVRVTFSAR